MKGGKKWSVKSVPGDEASIGREVDYIVELAQAREGRIVSLGSLILFSTSTGDAWLLDPEDQHALCLARDGVRQPARILEHESRFAIEWDRSQLGGAAATLKAKVELT